MDAKQIIMNYTVAPSAEDFEVLAKEIISSLPDELVEFCEELLVQLEEFPDDTTMQDLDVEDPYDLLALYKSGKELSPGVERKVANDDDVLVIFRRPVLDMWCEGGEDLTPLLRQIIIEELGQNFDFSDDEIEEMSQNYQAAF